MLLRWLVAVALVPFQLTPPSRSTRSGGSAGSSPTRIVGTALAALTAHSGAAPQKRKPQRSPDVRVLKVSSVRQEGRIAYQGAYKITGERPVAGLVIHLEFFESRGILLSMQKIQLEDAPLQPGEEREFEVQGKDVPRAVSFRVSFTDVSGRDLSVAGVGPYPLD